MHQGVASSDLGTAMFDDDSPTSLTARVHLDPRWVYFKALRPDWDVRFARSKTPECIDWRGKMIIISCGVRNPMLQISHSWVHLAYHAVRVSSRFTRSEEFEADWMGTWMLANMVDSLADPIDDSRPYAE